MGGRGVLPGCGRVTVNEVATNAALRRSQAWLKALFDAVDDFLFVIDQEAKILAVNPAVIQRLDYPQEELIGQIFGFACPEQQKTHWPNTISGQASAATTVDTSANGVTQATARAGGWRERKPGW